MGDKIILEFVKEMFCCVAACSQFVYIQMEITEPRRIAESIAKRFNIELSEYTKNEIKYLEDANKGA